MKILSRVNDGTYVKFMDVEQPKIMSPTDVLIKVHYSAVCADERREEIGWNGYFGHEISGTIVDMGSDVLYKNLHIGDRVTGNYSFYCEKCFYCASGRKQLCLNVDDRAMGMAEYLLWDEQQCYKIPDNIPMEQACLTEPLSCCIRAVEEANISYGSRVAIFGGGGIGLMLLQLVKHYGAGEVLVVEPIEVKRKYALELGADYVLDPYAENIYRETARISKTFGFDVTFEASGSDDALLPVTETLGNGGTVIMFSLHKHNKKIPISINQMYTKEITIKTIYTAPYHFQQALQIMPFLKWDILTKHIIPLEKIYEAFDPDICSVMPRTIIKMP